MGRRVMGFPDKTAYENTDRWRLLIASTTSFTWPPCGSSGSKQVSTWGDRVNALAFRSRFRLNSLFCGDKQKEYVGGRIFVS